MNSSWRCRKERDTAFWRRLVLALLVVVVLCAVSARFGGLVSIGKRAQKSPSTAVQTTRAPQNLYSLTQLLKNRTSTRSLLRELEAAYSGDEFLEGHTQASSELKKQTDQYDRWGWDAAIKTICETGFNGGHSAARFLNEGEAHVYEFDIGQHSYGKDAEKFLSSKFPGRLNVMWGDSTQTLVDFHNQNPDVRCDLVIVDGGHIPEVADADLRNFALMASPFHLLTIDDTPCKAEYCEGPTQTWKNLVDKGCIKELEQVPMGGYRGFTVGQYTPCSEWPSELNQRLQEK